MLDYLILSKRHIEEVMLILCLVRYCNMMYVVAGHVIETLTGGSLEMFLKERIWQPLGMKSTVSSSLHPLKPGLHKFIRHNYF